MSTLKNLSAILTARPAPMTLRDLNAVTSRRLAERPVDATFSAELASMLAELNVPAPAVASVASRRLSTIFGWNQVDLSAELPDWGELMRARDGDGAYCGDEVYEREFLAATARFPGIIGKGDSGIYPTPDATAFDLGDDHWRLVDFLRAESLAEHHVTLEGKRFTLGDKSLGDGVCGRVRPESLQTIMGREVVLKGREDTFLQVRGFILSGPNRCVKVFKGLLHVTNNPGEHGELFAPESGYGTLHTVTHADTVILHEMVDVRDYSPQGRVSSQAGAYEGKPGWFEHHQAGYAYAADELFDGARMALTGAPIYFLPVAEPMRVARGAFQALVSIPMGVRRKVAPNPTLRPFEFRAPGELASMFRVGERYVVHRDPALPDGTSAYSATCTGYTWGNYFEVATNESPNARGAAYGVWEQTGGDFDGDDALVLPHHTSGGLLLGFNDRPAEEQQALIDAAGEAGRKMAGFKKQNYPSGLVRWMRQRQSAVELGLLDFRARKLLDLGSQGRFEAAGLKPYIQVAVDRQKRNLPYPSDLREMPPLRGEFGTKLLSFIKKPDVDVQDDKTSWKHSWDICRALAAVAEQIAGRGDVDTELGAELIMRPEHREALRPVARWAAQVFRAMERILGASRFADGAGYPRANLFPKRQISEWQAQRRAEMGEFLPAFDGLAELEATITRLRGRSAVSARAAEALLVAFASGLEESDRHALCTQLGDAQMFVKAAPLEDLEAVFAGFGPEMHRLSDLPGVLVVGAGQAFQRRTPHVMVNAKPVALGGVVVEPGAVELRQVARSGGDALTRDAQGRVTGVRCERRWEVQLLRSGTVLAVTPGSFDGDLRSVYNTLVAQVPRVMRAADVDALSAWQIPAELLAEKDSGEAQDDLGFVDEDRDYDAEFVGAEPERVDVDADAEYLALWDEARGKGDDVRRLVWLAIGDHLARLGVQA